MAGPFVANSDSESESLTIPIALATTSSRVAQTKTPKDRLRINKPKTKYKYPGRVPKEIVDLDSGAGSGDDDDADAADYIDDYKEELAFEQEQMQALLSRLASTDGSQTTIPSPSTRVRPKGVMRFPVFEERLGEYLTGYYALDGIDIHPFARPLLHSMTITEWHDIIAPIVLDQVKGILSRPSAPSIDELMTLPHIGDTWHPGVYIGNILTNRLLHDGHDFIYVGSATQPARGLAVRVGMHLDPKYRAGQKAKKKSLHYSIVDQLGRGRTEHFRKLAQTEFWRKAAQHITHVRFTCVLTEQLLMSWLGGFSTRSMVRQSTLAQFTPWEEFEYLGTNGSPPLKQNPKSAEKDAEAMTPEEYRQRHAQNTELYRQSMSAIEHAAYLSRNRAYYDRVAKPVKAMRDQGASEAEIEAFKQVRHTETTAALPPRLLGSGKRYVFEDDGYEDGVQVVTDPDMVALAEDYTNGKRYKAPGRRTLRPDIKKIGHGKACKGCVKAKRRCDGDSPCAECTRKGIECEPQSPKSGL